MRGFVTLKEVIPNNINNSFFSQSDGLNFPEREIPVHAGKF